MEIIIAGLVVLVCIALIAGITIAFLLSLVGGLMTGVPYLAAPRKLRTLLPDLYPLTPGSVFYDLGCGDGRFVWAMARRYPGATCIGVEMAPLPSILLWLRSRLTPLTNAHAVYGNFSNVGLGEATHVFLYLFPHLMAKLLPKLDSELPHGARVISCDFPFPSRAPASTIPLGTGAHPHTLYVYEF